ncbi:MAG: helix-turn-helix domain-containing protein [Candidatus Hydrogenedentes bacterium]|nr:helix-turn-helix domain-containing protein [Candidatus Hydrogenedentota bacterium]
MKKKTSELSVFELIMTGLEDSIAFSKGEKMSLATVQVPAPPPSMGAKEVTQIRAKLRMSQGVFAAALNVSPKTVQAWEQGLREPGNASLRLLQIARDEPEVVVKTMRERVSGYSPTKKQSTAARRKEAKA